MTTFALVPGAWHAPAHFDLLVAELAARGHRGVAVDLPCSDPAAGCEAYADAVEAALPADDGDVVVMGHSLGGLTIPVVAARRPVRGLAYVCALVPEPGRSMSERLRAGEPVFLEGFGTGVARDDQGRSFWADADAAIAWLYGDCPRPVAEAAVAALRPQGRQPSVEACPLPELPAVPVVSVVCTEDLGVSPAWSRTASRERLGVEPVELPGGHSPFLSRPAALADVLIAAFA